MSMELKLPFRLKYCERDVRLGGERESEGGGGGGREKGISFTPRTRSDQIGF